MKYEITCKRGFNDLKIFINNILHIHIETDKYLGCQSYYLGTKKEQMIIEFILTQGTMISKYHNEEIWKQVLKLIDENI